MDLFFGMDTQKDTIVNSINTVMLDPTGGNQVIHIGDINSVIVKWKRAWTWWLFGYWAFGYNERSICEFYWSGCISIIGIFYVKKRGKGRIANKFISENQSRKKQTFLKIVEESEER